MWPMICYMWHASVPHYVAHVAHQLPHRLARVHHDLAHVAHELTQGAHQLANQHHYTMNTSVAVVAQITSSYRDSCSGSQPSTLPAMPPANAQYQFVFLGRDGITQWEKLHFKDFPLSSCFNLHTGMKATDVQWLPLSKHQSEKLEKNPHGDFNMVKNGATWPFKYMQPPSDQTPTPFAAMVWNERLQMCAVPQELVPCWPHTQDVQGLWMNSNTTAGPFFRNPVQLLIRKVHCRMLTVACTDQPAESECSLTMYTMAGTDVCNMTVRAGQTWNFVSEQFMEKLQIRCQDAKWFAFIPTTYDNVRIGKLTMYKRRDLAMPLSHIFPRCNSLKEAPNMSQPLPKRQRKNL